MNRSLMVMVLNDGETFTNLHGCKIVEVPAHVEDDKIDWYVKFGPQDRIVTEFRHP